MRRFGAAIIAALLVGGLSVPAAFAASPAAHRAVPKVVFIVGPAGAATSGYRAQARSAAAIARQVHPGCRRALLAQRDLDRRQGRPQGRVAGRLHGPREWLAESLPRFALSDHAGRLRPQSDRRRRRLPAPVLRRGVDRFRGEAGEERRRAHEPPVLRERQLGAGAAGGHARRREAAGRQLRGRLHPGRCVGGDRRGMVEPFVLRAGHPRRRPVHPDGVAEESQRERAPDRFLERAQPGLRRADGSGERDLGLRAIDRHEERAGTEGRPGRRRRIGQRGSSAGGSARADA